MSPGGVARDGGSQEPLRTREVKVCVSMTARIDLDDLSVHVQHVNGDLHIPGHALPTLLKLTLFQGDIQIIPHFTWGWGDSRRGEDAGAR